MAYGDIALISCKYRELELFAITPYNSGILAGIVGRFEAP